jgi:putative intracellular protease/amidase
MRKDRRLANARLAVLEMAGYALGFMPGGKTRGRRPAGMAEVYPELQQFVKRIFFK